MDSLPRVAHRAMALPIACRATRGASARGVASAGVGRGCVIRLVRGTGAPCAAARAGQASRTAAPRGSEHAAAPVAPAWVALWRRCGSRSGFPRDAGSSVAERAARPQVTECGRELPAIRAATRTAGRARRKVPAIRGLLVERRAPAADRDRAGSPILLTASVHQRQADACARVGATAPDERGRGPSAAARGRRRSTFPAMSQAANVERVDWRGPTRRLLPLSGDFSSSDLVPRASWPEHAVERRRDVATSAPEPPPRAPRAAPATPPRAPAAQCAGARSRPTPSSADAM